MEAILKTIGKTVINLTESGIVHGVQGMLVKRNLENYWFHYCVRMPGNYNVFLTTSDRMDDTLSDLKEIDADNLPFGLATIENVKNTWNQNLLPDQSKSNHTLAKIITVCNENEGLDLFHKKQQQRKAWWRKFSQNPAIFFLTEVNRVKSNNVLEIEAQFPFGNIVVERINYIQDARKFFSKGKKELSNANTSAVEHVCSLDWGCLALVCDAFTEIGDSKEMHLSPKLAGYRVSFRVDEDEESIKTDLYDLTLHLTTKFREHGIDSVIADAKMLSAFQIPYTIVVNKESLKNGLVKVVNQVTTIGEAVHITELVKHILRRCY